MAIDMDRRAFLRAAGAAAAAMTLGAPAGALPLVNQEREMYGLIGKMTAVPGQRDALIAGFADQIVTTPVGGHGLTDSGPR
jgi:hypothetical protein